MPNDSPASVVRQFIDEVFVAASEQAADRLLSPAFTAHTWPSVEPGVESFKQAMRRMAAAVSDVSMTVEDVVADGERVAVRLTSRATQSGELMGLPASGKRYEISEIHIFRVVDGRITEHWHVADLLSMMRQLGALPGGGTSS
jgi:steroid delta-isomerase-like uncharacterized protein